MKHAGAQALAELSPLLEALRALPGLVERKPGIFYRRGAAFLHFHEDATGLWADLKRDGRFERHRVSDAAGQAALQAAAAALALSAPSTTAVWPPSGTSGASGPSARTGRR